jgi:two-component system OmpR family sensor kinase
VGEDRHLVEEERKRLISVVSHELRTPLTAVDGYIDLALANWNSPNDDEKREMIEIAQDQARLVTRIVTDLVATSRDSLHATDLELEAIDIGAVVDEVAIRHGLGTRLEVRQETRLEVTADKVRLAQIITNLLSNADRYGEGGPIVCVLRRAGDQVEIAIHDGGPGVPARFRDSIWGAFERGVHRFDAATPGSGLGLAIVRSLAQAHEGSVGYRSSELLGGACFWVRLPRAATAPTTDGHGMITSPKPVDSGAR